MRTVQILTMGCWLVARLGGRGWGNVDEPRLRFTGQERAPNLTLHHLAARGRRQRAAQEELAWPHVLREARLLHQLRQCRPQLPLEFG